jgi:antitoxin ParD1/3/4
MQGSLPNFGKIWYSKTMSTMNISLPEELKVFVDQHLQAQGYGTSSEYIRELIRRDRDRVQLREELMQGVRSGPAGSMDKGYFASLRKQVGARAKKGA